jgi:hypothetical protein
LYKVTVSFTILVSILLVIGIRQLGSDPLFACGLFGSFLIYLGSRPSPRHIALSIGAGVIVEVLYTLMGNRFGPFSFETLSYIKREHGFVTLLQEVQAIGAFLGVGSILIMSLDKVWNGSSRYLSFLGDALLLPGFSLFVGLVLQLAVKGSHLSFDFMLYRLDSSLGLAPGHAAVALFRKVPWIETASNLIYVDLLLFPQLFYAWSCYKGKAAKVHLLRAYVIVGVGGLLYLICPAMGPIYAFGQQFPDHLPAITAVPAKAFMATGLFNAMPSLHMAWALLIWVAAWELGSFAVTLASVMVIFTGIATVGSGEHYLIDLFVAAPLVMMVYGICTSRHRLTAAGLGFVVAWTVYLRTGIELPGSLNWLFVVATVGTTVYMMRSFLTTREASTAGSSKTLITSAGEMCLARGNEELS